MISLLGAFLGFLGSAFPEFMKVYRDHKDRDHELAVMDRQIHIMQAGHNQRLEEINIQADESYAKSLYAHARHTGVRWVDALSGTVRPLVTYAFFFLYACVKIAHWHYCLIHAKTQDSLKALVHTWTPEDQVLFATVISFWFGQRMLNKAFAKKLGT